VRIRLMWMARGACGHVRNVLIQNSILGTREQVPGRIARRPGTRGIEVPRLRRPPLARLLRAGALFAAFVAAPWAALAQGRDTTDQFLMRPQVDGDPRNPPRFTRPGSLVQDPNADQFGQPQNFSYRPGIGAGSTGFDSTNARRQKDKKGQKAKSAPRTGLSASGPQGAQAPGSSAQSSSSQTTTTATDQPAVVSPTAARFTQNQNQNQNQAQSQNQKQNQSLNQTQQPRASPSTNTSYPVGPLVDPQTLPARRRLTPDDDPFIPTGVQVGAFLLKPAIEVTGAYDTNPARVSQGTPSWYAVVAPELLLNSNWSRHELTANLRGSYTSYENASELNRPNVDAKVNGRIDMTPWTRADLEGRFLVGTDNPGSPNIQAGLKRLPIFTTLGGSAGIGQRVNRFEVTAKGSVDRTVYQQSTFVDGQTESNADRDFNRYLGELKAGYELMPGVKPFVESGADQRVHDLEVDRNGVQRDSTGLYAKGGATFELSRILTGDAAVGWIHRTYQDPTLPKINGLTVDSSLTWLASALTTVKLTAVTRVDESTLVGVAGVFTREITLQVDHAFRRWLIATARFSRINDDYVGSPRDDHRYAAGALITYKLTRELWLKAEYRHEWLRSNEVANNYDADVVLFGVRLQR
jgi:hypothetical protein